MKIINKSIIIGLMCFMSINVFAQTNCNNNPIPENIVIEIEENILPNAIVSKQDIIKINNIDYISLRTICDNLELPLSWDNGFMIFNNTNSFSINNTLYQINSSFMDFPPPIMNNGKTYIPIEFLTVGLNWFFEYNNDEVNIYKNNPNQLYEDDMEILENNKVYSLGKRIQLNIPIGTEIIVSSNVKVIDCGLSGRVIIEPIKQGIYYVQTISLLDNQSYVYNNYNFTIIK